MAEEFVVGSTVSTDRGVTEGVVTEIDPKASHNVRVKWTGFRAPLWENTQNLRLVTPEVAPEPEPKSDRPGFGNPQYTGGMPEGVEAIDIIEAQGWLVPFALGNTLKYVTRAYYKDQLLSDLHKAQAYLGIAIKKLEKDAS